VNKTSAARDRIKMRHFAGHFGYTLLGLLITVVMLFPFYMIFNISLMRQTELLQYPPPLFPLNLTFAGYRDALGSIGEFLRSSLIYGLSTVILTMLVALPASYSLSRSRVHFGSFLLFALVIAQMIPSIVIANSLYAVFSHLHLLNTFGAVILADSTGAIPFAIIVMRAFMASIPRELDEAAVVDGAGHWRIFWSIILPLSKTVIITASLFAFLFGWGDFLFALTLNGDPQHIPITVGIYLFIGGYSINWPAVMATSMVAAIPAIFLLVFAQRYISAGITTGAIKE
jgi:multiple sugar transport system permease protein